VIDVAQLARLLPEQRWFGGKGRTISSLQVWDEATVDEGPPALVFSVVSVDFSDGSSDCYHVPLVVSEDGTIRDAFEDVERLAVLGRLMTHGETVKGTVGVFHFGGPGLDPRSPPGDVSIRRITVEQSNSSLVLDETYIVKLFRRVEPGPNPEVELTRLLTNEGFESIPAHVGEVLYEGQADGDDIEIDLGVAQQLVEGHEGWQEMLDVLRRVLDETSALPNPETVETRAGAALDDLERLGNVTASLHVVLAREGLEPDISSEPIGTQDLTDWAERTVASVVELVDSGMRELAPHADAISERTERLVSVADPGLKTRIHGDYHLGQVLLGGRGWMILDLEGEPARSLEERRAKHSPLRDVAGMLRSFSYAASVALFERGAPESKDWARLQPLADEWERLARQRYVSAYLRTSHEGGFLPPDRDDLFLMLDVFEIDKALYELAYERGHRPRWTRIPLLGIIQILEGTGGR
jgi:trehalose synthase-fused probable maltokinase